MPVVETCQSKFLSAGNESVGCINVRNLGVIISDLVLILRNQGIQYFRNVKVVTA